MTLPLELRPVNAEAVGVYTAQGGLVGNLKRIGKVWKFKAIGVEADGQLVPGGGPLTERHNTVFQTAEAAEVNAVLGPFLSK